MYVCMSVCVCLCVNEREREARGVRVLVLSDVENSAGIEIKSLSNAAESRTFQQTSHSFHLFFDV